MTLADARVLVALLETGDVIDEKIGDRVFKTKSSAELPRLNVVVEWAKAAGLVRVVRGRLVPVKKAAALLKDPGRLREAAFAVLGKLGEPLFPTGYWRSSLVGMEFALVWPALQRRLYGGAAAVEELRELAWGTASPYYDIPTPRFSSRWSAGMSIG